MKFKYPYKGPYPSHSQRLRLYGHTQLAEGIALLALISIPYFGAIYLLTRATLYVTAAVAQEGLEDVPALVGIGVLHLTGLLLANKALTEFLKSRQLMAFANYLQSQDPGPASMDDEEKR